MEFIDVFSFILTGIVLINGARISVLQIK